MTTTLDDLFKTETRDNVMSDLLGIASAIRLKVTAWQPGQPIRTTLALVSQKVADLTILTQLAVKGGLLDYATEGWLTLLASSLYRVVRNPAQYAIGDTFTIVNSSDESFDRDPGEISIAHNVTGKTYHNVNAVSVGPGVTATGLIFEADEVGTGSDAGPDTIQQLVTSTNGITVTNVEAVLGADEEEDDPLRDRCREKLGALSPNGPKEAYAYVLKTPLLTPTSIPITRIQGVLNVDTGVYSVYCANANGAPSTPDIVIADASLDRWATPWGVDAPALKAIEIDVPIAYEIWLEGSNLTTPQVEALISAALARLFKSWPVGGKIIPPSVNGGLYVDQIKATILEAVSGVTRLTVTSGLSAVVDGFTVIPVTQGRVLVLGAITPTVTVVP